MKRLSVFAVALLTLAFFAVCGPASLEASSCPAPPKDVGSDVMGLVLDQAKDFVDGLKDLADEEPAAQVAGGAKLAIWFANLAFKLNSTMDANPSTWSLFCKLEDDLYKIGSILYDKGTKDQINDGFAELYADLDLAWEAAYLKQSLPWTNDANKDGNRAVKLAYVTDALSTRLYNPRANDGSSGEWKRVIPEPKNADGTVYDWRYSVPYLMSAIGLRLPVITALDPNWSTNSLFDQELREHADGLRNHWLTMTAGVQCGYKTLIDGPISDNTPIHYSLACADIYTGISRETRWPSGSKPSPDQVTQLQQIFTSQVIAQMPLFEMRSMIDRLHFYRSHAPDLTEVWHRIPVAADRTLCLDVQGGSATSGTPVVLGTCSPGKAGQQWVYYRELRAIYNPALNKCLDVHRYVDGGPLGKKVTVPIPGTPVLSADCLGYLDFSSGVGVWKPNQYQQWTYDPNTKVVANAFGTVLYIQRGDLRDGKPVWVWTYNAPDYGGRAQQWYADPRLSICSTSCLF